MAKIYIKINGKKYSGSPGETVLDVAEKNGIEIPNLCRHKDFCNKANCRVCVVEVKGARALKTSCSTTIEEGMEVETESERAVKARNNNLELIFAEHIEKCATCVWRFECKLLHYANIYKISLTVFKDRKGDRKTFKFANAVEIDGTQCIDCRNCLDACSKQQKINFLELKGKGAFQEVVPTGHKGRQCILCGQCAVHCPVSAAQEQMHWQEVEGLLKNKKSPQVAVVQIAPSVRVSIGEDFGLPYGAVMTENLAAALRRLGFDFVFDVNFGADITTMVEAEELLARIKNKGKMPMMTSCCPGWVNYIEFYHPELLAHLTTARSPHIHNGGAIKTYWADKMKIDPAKITVVSIMPCTAKKFEAAREEMKVNGLLPVDLVLTTRELSFLLKKNGIDLKTIKPEPLDNPLGDYSGAAAIYGASGGVMESALRTAHRLACAEKEDGVCAPQIDFHAMRGLEGAKEAVVNIAGSDLRVAVVNGIGNIQPVLDRLNDFDYIEVMACRGGCIGGGGQPIPTDDEIRHLRMEALYEHDRNLPKRRADENEGVGEVLKWLKAQGRETEHGVLHTTYQKREKIKT